ncbi:MAG TPA: hypothetical protein PLN31_17325 [Azoarcus taiwanensis]|nr:hypothetical protein [Azoarcus taiwanensis]
MGMLEDVMKALERLPVWKRLIALPQQVEDLQVRVAELECKLGPKPGAECPMCGERTMKVIATRPHPRFGMFGTKLDTVQCTACNHKEDRERNPPASP